MRHLTRLSLLTLVLALVAGNASAACMNRFVSRAERPHQVVTLLTGKLTFQEAQTLAKAIASKNAPPIEWVDDNGKTLAKQFGELKVVRPMPVGCDGKSSGVVMIVSFPTALTPSKKMNVKLDANTTVAFEQQSD
jgi:hypothetical protein